MPSPNYHRKEFTKFMAARGYVAKKDPNSHKTHGAIRLSRTGLYKAQSLVLIIGQEKDGTTSKDTGVEPFAFAVHIDELPPVHIPWGVLNYDTYRAIWGIIEHRISGANLKAIMAHIFAHYSTEIDWWQIKQEYDKASESHKTDGVFVAMHFMVATGLYSN
jgi:hypothetical protein